MTLSRMTLTIKKFNPRINNYGKKIWTGYDTFLLLLSSSSMDDDDYVYFRAPSNDAVYVPNTVESMTTATTAAISCSRVNSTDYDTVVSQELSYTYSLDADEERGDSEVQEEDKEQEDDEVVEKNDGEQDDDFLFGLGCLPAGTIFCNSIRNPVERWHR